MLKAMANLIRPATDRRATRHTRSRSPPPAEVARTAAHQQQPPLAPIFTRRLSKTLLLSPQDLGQPNAIVATPVQQASPARSSSRKRSIAEVDTPDARPPARTKQRRSCDEVPGSTNGVTKKLHSNVEDVPSGASTPKPDDAAQTTSTMDKKSLRSADHSVRKATQLSEIFEDYETTIANWEESESADNSAHSSPRA